MFSRAESLFAHCLCEGYAVPGNWEGGIVMSEPPGTTFAPERILKQAQGNGTGVTLGIIAYLKEHGQSPSGLFTSIGQRFAPTWEGMKGRGAKEVARGAALNMVSLGARCARWAAMNRKPR
jgi:hypothetical protein